MVKTRFGETLPKISNVMQVIPFEHSQRHLRQISDMATYRKVHATLPAAEFSAFKSRIKHGDLNGSYRSIMACERQKLVVDTICLVREKFGASGMGVCGRAMCPHGGDWSLAAKGRELQYAFGDTHVVGKSKLPDIINSVISSLATPDSESVANSLVLVGHNISGDLDRLADLKISKSHPPSISYTYSNNPSLQKSRTTLASLRHAVFGPQLPREAPLARLLAAQARAPRCTLGNAGNDAWLALGAMIALIDRNATPLNSATIGGAAQSPIPRPPLSSQNSGNPPQIGNPPPVRPRFNSTVFPSSTLPFPSNPSTDMLPLPSPNANPNARPISAVFARPRTGSAGAVANSRHTLSLNGLSPNYTGRPLSVPDPNPNVRPISIVMNQPMGGSPRNSVNLAGEFGEGTMSRSWNGRSTLASGRPATPLGLFDAKPGARRQPKLVVSPSVRPDGDESTESESEDEPRDSGEEPRRSMDKGRGRFL
ncbi:hypothetical protein FRC06_004252 [Ceratobasidium sp. 370]|nr:hypothetical protein FRC06_004252 [Ceratobasidium sp. 370]